ncbi:MAG: PaaI family thioesterase [Pseudomonadales bacterium]|nr:PaaI family thioesterase [Pseudomonadales bacterium]
MAVKEELQQLPPHAVAIGMEVVDVVGNQCIAKVPYAEHLVGDPDTGIIHGGVITATLDNASGWAVRCHEDYRPDTGMATLDLRIDYMKPAEPHQDLFLLTECIRMASSIAFVKGIAWQGSEDNIIATSVASFMLGATPPLPEGAGS